MNVLIHADFEDACCVINGTLHRLAPRVPYVVDEHVPEREGTGLGSSKAQDDRPTNIPFITEKLMEQLWWAGVVRVQSERTPYGTDQITQATVEAAIHEAEEKLYGADMMMLEQYKENQAARAQEGKPALAPTGRHLTVITRRNIDVRKYGINPVGADVVDQGQQVAQLQKALADQGKLLEQLLANQAESKTTKREKVTA